MSSAASSDSTSTNQPRFSAVRTIIGDRQPLVQLVCRVRSQLEPLFSGGVREPLPEAKEGGYNVIQVLEFSDGIKWVVRIPGIGLKEHFNKIEEMALRNTAATMIFLQKSTTIPVPEIYAFDHTVDNEIGVPYIMMSFLEGRPVSELWFDRSGPTPVDARRERILDTIALSMEQLGRFTFNGIGTLQFAEPMAGPLADVGPLYTIDPGADLALDSISGAWQAGPFEDSKSCFKALLNRRQGSWPPCGFSELLRLMIDSIPPSRISPMSHSRESFVLSHPDYDSQNFLAREDGTLTGILDWDNVHTLPRCIGYDRFPGWLTRDWDPIRYGFGCENSREEDSPDTLERWRAYWTSKFTDSSWTKTSHVYEAIWIAATDQVCWAQIMDQIANILLCGSEKAEELPSRPEVLYDLEKGVLSVQGKKELLRRIRVLMGLSSTAASEASRET